MKKIILIACVLCLHLTAATKDEVLKYLELYFPKDAKVSLNIIDQVSINEIPQTSAFYYEVKEDGGKRAVRDVIFSQEDYIFAEQINIRTKNSLKQQYTKYFLDKSLLPLAKSEQDYILLKSENAKSLMTIFIDPECPYCRVELSHFEEYLKTNDIKLIFTPVHGKSAFQKVVLMFEELKENMTNKQKISVLKKYFDVKYGVSVTPSENKVIKAIKTKDKYINSGLKGVPYMIMEKY